MLWRKPAGMKYTDMCIFIDQNVPNILNPGENPELEETIYNYLWLLVKALAIKKRMFQNFEDYDPFAFHAASRLFFALRKNQLNQGKIIKGKLIRPIKSCLNYTKALMYPMKVEYQQQVYKEVVSEEFVSKRFDATQFKDVLRTNAKSSQGVTDWFWIYLKDSLNHCDAIITKVLEKSPFSKSSLEYKQLKIAVYLNVLQTLKERGKLDTPLLLTTTWKLPKSLQSYIKIILKEFFKELHWVIKDCYKAADLDDETLDAVLAPEMVGGNKKYED